MDTTELESSLQKLIDLMNLNRRLRRCAPKSQNGIPYDNTGLAQQPGYPPSYGSFGGPSNYGTGYGNSYTNRGSSSNYRSQDQTVYGNYDYQKSDN